MSACIRSFSQLLTLQQKFIERFSFFFLFFFFSFRSVVCSVQSAVSGEINMLTLILVELLFAMKMKSTVSMCNHRPQYTTAATVRLPWAKRHKRSIKTTNKQMSSSNWIGFQFVKERTVLQWWMGKIMRFVLIDCPDPNRIINMMSLIFLIRTVATKFHRQLDRQQTADTESHRCAQVHHLNDVIYYERRWRRRVVCSWRITVSVIANKE